MTAETQEARSFLTTVGTVKFITRHYVMMIFPSTMSRRWAIKLVLVHNNQSVKNVKHSFQTVLNANKAKLHLVSSVITRHSKK